MPAPVAKLLNLKNHKLPFFVLLFLCFASSILGDSVAEALLLAHFDASVIPGMYMVNAVLLFVSSSFIMYLIDRMDRGSFFLVLTLSHAAFLVVVRLAVSFGLTFLYIPLFSYAYITKIFLFLMFWTLANDVIDSRRAGKEFPFIAAGGTTGAIGISFAIPWLLRVFSAQSLLVVWAFLAAGTAVCFLPIRTSFGKEFKPKSDRDKRISFDLRSMGSDIALLQREPLLLNMAVLYFMIFFVLLNQHYSFYSAIKLRFGGVEDMAAFLGYFNGVSMAVTFLLQIGVSGRVIRRIGSTRSMFLLPAVFCLVFGCLSLLGFAVAGHGEALLVLPVVFWGVTMGVGLRIAFFDSFFSPNFQVFFSSLPQQIRGRGKLALEGVVKPAAMICASVWLLYVAPGMSFSVNMIVLLAIAGGMVYQTFRLRAKYTESLTKYLASFDSRVSLSFLEGGDLSRKENVIEFLADKLESEPYDIKCYLIELLAEMRTDESVGVLTEYLERADNKTRATIVASLTNLKIDSLRPLFSSLLVDTDHRVVARAIFALAAYGDLEINSGLEPFLSHDNNRVRANTVVALWPSFSGGRQDRLVGVVEEMLDSRVAEHRESALYAARELGPDERISKMLESFLDRHGRGLLSDRDVWQDFIQAAGCNPSPVLVDRLIALYHGASRKQKSDIAVALDESRLHGYEVSRLLSLLWKGDFVTRNAILRAICLGGQTLGEKDTRILLDLAEEEAGQIYDDWYSVGILTAGNPNSSVKLLSLAVREDCIEDRLDNLIYVAAVLDVSGQIKRIMGRLRHENPHVRGRALEVIDNVGNPRVNRWILRLLDTDNAEKHAREAEAYSGRRGGDVDALQVIVSYTECPVTWVKACAAYALASPNG